MEKNERKGKWRCMKEKNNVVNSYRYRQKLNGFVGN